MNKLNTTHILLALALLLAACSGVQPDQDASTLTTWIDAPLDQSTIAMAPTNIVFSTSTSSELDHFELWLNGDQLASVPQSYSSNNDGYNYFYGEFNWEPAAPGTYLIQVRPITSQGQGSFAEAEVMVQGPVDVIEGVEATEPSEPSTEVLAFPLQDTNCRYGCQASQFDIADTLLEGIGYQVNAISQDGLFVQFVGPATGQLCWAPASLLDLQLNGESVEASTLIPDPIAINSCPATPTPLPTATNTPGPTNSPVPPQCSDGLDNDGDGRIDYGSAAAIAGGTADRECSSPDDNDESN